jgi:hypothetical protein
MKAKVFAAALGASAFLASGAFAASLITVDVSNVANNIAKNLSVDVSQIPVTVQVPVDVAANVCNVAVSVLGTSGSGGTCKAVSDSTALDQAVQAAMKK